jgi:hypothetical protein
MIISVISTTIVVVLLLAVEHLLPWQAMFKSRLHPLINYVMGMLAINVPFSIFLGMWDQWVSLAVLWLITVCGGIAVGLLYALDWWLDIRVRLEALVRENRILRPDGTPEK